ncbi:MAG: hypothetical protein JXA10_14070 [Anaerolineae bacterium]|nr:hypothetical protein [Anaerolineae bacterium]
MLRRFIGVLLIGAMLFAGISLPVASVVAQDGPQGFTSYQLNMRSGPGATYDVITILSSNTGLILEARNADTSWVLGHTEDGVFRGWVASLYLYYQDGFSPVRLPVSEEVVNYTPAASAGADSAADANVVAVDAPSSEGLAPSGVNETLESLPIVPSVSGYMRTIFERGQALGNQANVVTKVGECNSMSWAFLAPFNDGNYDLGAYGYLQNAISQATFVNPSAAALDGYTSLSVLDPSWADPSMCSGLAPLECEYQRSKPSVAFIMLGMHDVHFMGVGEYEQAMRRIVEISLDHGVIPVLTTFPVWPDGDGRTQARFDFNTTLVRLASEYGVPLMNFWRASQSVQHSGVGVDHVHITERGDLWTSFNGDEYQYGMTMWNLVALQTLDQIQRVAIN